MLRLICAVFKHIIMCGGLCRRWSNQSERQTHARSCNNLACSSPGRGRCRTPSITPVTSTDIHKQLSNTDRQNLCNNSIFAGFFEPLTALTHPLEVKHMQSKEKRQRQSTSGLSRDGRRSCCVCQR